MLTNEHARLICLAHEIHSLLLNEEEVELLRENNPYLLAAYGALHRMAVDDTSTMMDKPTIPVENEFPAANSFEDSPPEVQIAELESALKQAEAACITRLRERATALARAEKAEAENAILRGQAPLGVQSRMKLAKENAATTGCT